MSMTANEFRALALSLPEASEDAHMGHPDFRVRRKIFATLGPDEAWGMVKLRMEQQSQLIESAPDVFEPVNGGWGRRGYTRVRLEAALEPAVRRALIAAWHNIAPKRLARGFDEGAR